MSEAVGVDKDCCRTRLVDTLCSDTVSWQRQQVIYRTANVCLSEESRVVNGGELFVKSVGT